MNSVLATAITTATVHVSTSVVHEAIIAKVWISISTSTVVWVVAEIIESTEIAIERRNIILGIATAEAVERVTAARIPIAFEV